MERRTQVSLAIAVGLHAVVLVEARLCVANRASAPRVDERDAEIEIEAASIEPAASADVPGARASEPSPPTHANQRAERARTRESGVEDMTSAAEARSAIPDVPIARVTPPRESPVLSLTELGLEGPNRFLRERATATESALTQEAEDGVRRSIAEPLLQRDRGLGLGSDGEAIAVIEETTYASTTSVRGRAVLSVVANGMGVVTGVWCSDGDHAQWDAVVAGIAKALEGKRLRKPPGGRGVEMRIEVTSREEMPSGHDPGVEIHVLHIPVKRGRGPQSTRVDLLAFAPKVVIDEMPETAAAPPTWPMAHIEAVKIFATDGDLVDVGAAPRRVVHARVLDEHAL